MTARNPVMPRPLPRRRAFLRAAVGAAAALPAIAIGQRVSAGSRAPALPSELLNPDICRAAFPAPIVLPQKRTIRLTWNASSACTVGVPTAQEKGFFAAHNLDVEMINFGGS